VKTLGDDHEKINCYTFSVDLLREFIFIAASKIFYKFDVLPNSLENAVRELRIASPDIDDRHENTHYSQFLLFV
jgi:hypothetical protein